jgi:serine protease Do
MLFLMHANPMYADIDRAQFIQMSASIAKVEAVNDSGRLGVGTGVTVADGWVATNCHVTRHAQELRVVKGGVRFAVTAQLVDAKHDLCLLKAQRWGGKPVELGDSMKLRRGQAVAGMGYVGGIELTMRDGMIVALHSFDQARVIQTDAPFTSGASGGGLFDDQGRLIGLMTFRLRGGANHYFVIPVDWLKTLLNKRNDAKLELDTEFDTAFWQQAADAQPYFLQAAPLLQSENWSAANSLSEQWVKNEPDNADAWYSLGFSASKNASSKRASQALHKLNELDTNLATQLREALQHQSPR